MKTIEEKAKEAWEDYCYRAEGNLYSSVFQDAYKQGAEDALKHPWIKWTDRQPEDGTPIFAVRLNWNYGNPAYDYKYFGNVNKATAKIIMEHDAENIYWVPLPQGEKQGKEDNK